MDAMVNLAEKLSLFFDRCPKRGVDRGRSDLRRPRRPL